MKTTERPLALTITGTVLFLIGLAGIVFGVVRTGGLALPGDLFSWLNMFAGVGLLRFQRGWRVYVLVMLGYSLVVGLPFMVWGFFNLDRLVVQFPGILIDDRPHEWQPRLLLGCALIVFVAATGWMFNMLLRRDVRELFQRQRTQIS